MNNTDWGYQLFSFLNESLTPFHAVDNLRDLFVNNGFSPTKDRANKSMPYVECLGEGAMVAIIPGLDSIENDRPAIVISHLDSPCFKIKELADDYDCLARVSLSTYGGINLESFADRPLRLAGRAYVREDGPMVHKTFTSLQTMVIPSLAIHLQNDDKKTIQEQRQAIWSTKESTIHALLASELDCQQEDLMAWDGFLVSDDKTKFLHPEAGLFAGPRLDDLTMAFSAASVLSGATQQMNSQFAFFFNHEEIGSMSREGAFSTLFMRILEGYVYDQGGSRTDFLNLSDRGEVISLDLAHGYHPNYPSRYDKKTAPCLGKGVVIKRSAQGKYALSTELYARIKGLADDWNIPWQIYENHSDIRGGTTIGPMTSAQSGLRTVDIGAPILGMHAAIEVGDIRDFVATKSLIEAFYKGIGR